MKLRAFLIATALCALSACNSTGPDAAYGNTIPATAQHYGEYLAGSYAGYLNDTPARAAFYSRAFSRDHGNLKLGRKVMAFYDQLIAESSGEALEKNLPPGVCNRCCAHQF